MANKSNWKNFERRVAEALGGLRRHRTTEDYGKSAPDVMFPGASRALHSKLNYVAVECKKRRSLSVFKAFTEAEAKYGRMRLYENAPGELYESTLDDGGRNRIVLALLRPRTNQGRDDAQKTRNRMKRRFKKAGLKLSGLHGVKSFKPLVVVDLDFFKELWGTWLSKGG